MTGSDSINKKYRLTPSPAASLVRCSYEALRFIRALLVDDEQAAVLSIAAVLAWRYLHHTAARRLPALVHHVLVYAMLRCFLCTVLVNGSCLYTIMDASAYMQRVLGFQADGAGGLKGATLSRCSAHTSGSDPGISSANKFLALSR